MKFFGVKTFYHWKVQGKSLSNIEERVVIFKARNFDEAIKKAKKEATRYTEEDFVNPFGQKVRIKVLKFFEAFELFDDPESGCEVFSSTVPLKKNLTDNAIIHKLVDLDQTGIQKECLKLSMYFRNKLFSGELNEKEYLKKVFPKKRVQF